MKRLIILFTAVSLCVFMTACQSYRDRVMEKAVAGDAEFQGLLAGYYLGGYMFDVNYDLALKYARLSSGHRDPVGMCVYGVIMNYGMGNVAMDAKEAAKLFNAAFPGIRERSSSGNVEGQYYMALMLLNGYGVDKDEKRGAELMRLASEKNYIPAQAVYGHLLLRGRGVRKDIEAGRKLLIKAARQGSVTAQVFLGEMYLARDNYASALKWYESAAEHGSPVAMHQLSRMYFNGNGVKPDIRKATELLDKASSMNYPPAMTDLAVVLLGDKAGEDSRKRAFELLYSAMAREYVSACKVLGDFYYQETGGDPWECRLRAMELYRIALNNGMKKLEDRYLELDDRSGLYMFVNYAWKDVTLPSAWLASRSQMPRAASGYKAGIIKGSRDLFEKVLRDKPAALYQANDWYAVYSSGAPMEWAGEILIKVPEAKRNGVFFWLTYGTSANLAGRPELAMTSISKLKELAAAAKADEALMLNNFALVIETCALIQRGLKEEAYIKLFEKGRIAGDKRCLVNYINNFAKPVLVDKNKFAVASGIKISELGEFTAMPEPVGFYDYEENAITSPAPSVPEPGIEINVSAE
ncbi:MAG: sel1 repeat family protein [Victivallales bacterium]|nr:sel1 repeat family protein [Victivallales bacterium]